MFTRFLKISFVLLLAAATAYAAPPSRQFTYDTGTVISSDEVSSNEDVIFNYLSAGVDTFLDGSIVNVDINSAANIQSDKLNLTSIAQAILINSGGSLEVDGATNFDGSVDFDSTVDFSGATITAQATFANLVATTADINGGTIDGAAIGASSASTGKFTTLKVGTTNQGDILYDNGTSIVRLPPGTSGYALKTQGAGANPLWGQAGGLILDSVTTGTGTNTGDITLAADTNYEFTIEAVAGSGGDAIVVFVFNSDSTGTDYKYKSSNWEIEAAWVETLTDDDAAASLALGAIDSDEYYNGKGFINTTDGVTINAFLGLKSYYSGDASGDEHFLDLDAMYTGGNVTSFELQFSGTTTYTVRLYRYINS